MKVKIHPTTGGFGVFVIFTALYAAGTLGLPEISLFGHQFRVGEVPSPLVAIFGLPAALGLSLGQFIANTASHLGPIDLISPAFAFLGLLLILILRRRNVLVGTLLYATVTSLWFAYKLMVAAGISLESGVVSALSSQLIALTVGYAIYRTVRRTKLFSAE